MGEVLWGGASEDGDVVIAGRDCIFEEISCDVYEMYQYHMKAVLSSKSNSPILY